MNIAVKASDVTGIQRFDANMKIFFGHYFRVEVSWKHPKVCKYLIFPNNKLAIVHLNIY